MEPIIITAAHFWRGRFDVYADGRYILTSRTPLADAARVLAFQGADLSTPIALRRDGPHDIIEHSTIGALAGLAL